MLSAYITDMTELTVNIQKCTRQDADAIKTVKYFKPLQKLLSHKTRKGIDLSLFAQYLPDADALLRNGPCH